jgi:hypothetical protein
MEVIDWRFFLNDSVNAVGRCWMMRIQALTDGKRENISSRMNGPPVEEPMIIIFISG